MSSRRKRKTMEIVMMSEPAIKDSVTSTMVTSLSIGICDREP